jgi:signal transduction histidine kinase/CheY-like chemotaxis protein
MSSNDQIRLLRLVESLQRENEQLRQRASTESHSRLMAEDALGKTEDRLQLALDAAGLAMWEWNIANDAVYVSARFGQMLDDLPQGEAMARMWSSQELLARVSAPDHDAINKALLDVFKQISPRLEVEFRVSSPRGSVWIECVGEVVQRSMLGHAETMVGVIRDVTRRRQAQLEIEAARAEAIAANAAKDEFLAHISHEIRTPLNGVMGMNNLLAQTPLVPEQRQYVALVDSSSRALLALVNDLLDYSRLQAHKLVLEQVRFPLRRWLWEVVEPLRITATEKGLELLLQVSDALPQEVVGDPGRLRQVVINLVSNAIKFTDKGRVLVALTMGDATEQQLNLQLQVSDTGIGIAPDKQQSVFNAFVQADSTTSRRFGGTGLGLSICAKLVDLMGGRIELASALGKGSRFTVRMPLGIARDDVPITQFGPSDILANEAPAPSAVPRYAGLSALVVDDHSVNQLLATKLLQRLGFDVQVADDGAQAVRAVQVRKFDVLLMDIQMPTVDGRQATQQIRQWERAQNIVRTPIVALSAHASAADREQALASGMDGYLTKPLTADALQAALRATGMRSNPLALSIPAPLMQADKGGVDRVRLLARLAGDEALLHDMAQAFCTDLRDRMALVHAALQQKDWRVIGAQAHALDGALSTLTAQAASLEAKALERTAHSQDLPAAMAAFARLSSAAKVAYDTVKVW